jgi:hypothetical protein
MKSTDWSVKRKQLIRDFQRRHGLMVDGLDGPITWAKINELAYCQDKSEKRVPVPTPNSQTDPISVFRRTEFRTEQLSEAEIREKYGEPGDASQLKKVKFPFEMYLYGEKSTPIEFHLCHAKMVEPLETLLKTWLDELGMDFIEVHRLNHYFGSYNNRNVRGGSVKSRHAWGIAIDIDATHNGNQTPWDPTKIGEEGYATMPILAITIANRLGWICGASAWGKDAMHFQLD